IEVAEDGSEIPRDNLTARLTPCSEDNSLTVTDAGMMNGYRAVEISVPQDSQLDEVTVSFRYDGEGGTFTRNVVFKVYVPKIKFFQENLTLPAGILDEPAFLPFEVEGMGDDYELELELNGEDYEIDLLRCSDPEAKNVHFAALMEKAKKTGDAGFYTQNYLNVTARAGEREIKGSIPVLRMNLGLAIGINAINCYRVPKKESAGKAMKDMTPADFETSTTEARAYLITYDAENHQVIQNAAFPTVTFEPLDSEEPEAAERIRKAIAGLNIEVKVLDHADQFARLVFLCKGGFLDAPTRYIVRMKASYTAGEKTYTFEREVLLRSQASRVVAGVKENYDVYKYDEQIFETLTQIKAVIFDRYLENLFSVYAMIDRMIDGYDRAYGYDPYQVAKVIDVWERFQSGVMVGANAEVNQYGVADEMEALAAATRSWDGWQGIILRISLDIMTGGASEVIMVALDMNRGIMDYHKETGGKGTPFGYFKAGVIPLALATGLGVVTWAGKVGGDKLAKLGKQLTPEKTAAFLKKAAAVKETAMEMAALAASDAQRALGSTLRMIPGSEKIYNAMNSTVEKFNKIDPVIRVPRATRATNSVKSAVGKGKNAADDIVSQVKGAPKTVREQCLDMAGSAVNREGEAIYADLIRAKKALQASPADEVLTREYNQALVRFKSSHAAIEHANSVLPGEALAFRGAINADLEKNFTAEVERRLKQKIAEKYGVAVETVHVERATGNKSAMVKFGRDCDMTPKVVTQRGGTKYVSQATTDELLEASVRETIEAQCGSEFAQGFAQKGGYARKVDFTGCTPQHADYFEGGIEAVPILTEKEHMGTFVGEDKARSWGETLKYKGAHPYHEGLALECEALEGLSEQQTGALMRELEAYAKADTGAIQNIRLSDRAQKLKEAYALMEEGVYQPGKYGKKLQEKEWVSLCAGHGSTLTDQDYISSRILNRGSGQAMMEDMASRATEWTGERITLSEARKACEMNGTTLEAAINRVGEQFTEIDAKLGYGSLSQTTAAVGGGGAVNTIRNGQRDNS
ncbi:MAG: hypothetical protein IKQ87_12695, partial [Clostridia bacterium]|nr:hypothetical protein [Clostridia bacterium]